MLDRRVSANFHEPAPLAKVLAYLSEVSDSIILVDHAALAAAETSDLVEATVTADHQPLATVLADLLRPLGLTYRAMGSDVIQVLTKEAADERLDLEFYSIAAWLDAGMKPAAVIEQLKAKVGATAGATWAGRARSASTPLPLAPGAAIAVGPGGNRAIPGRWAEARSVARSPGSPAQAQSHG